MDGCRSQPDSGLWASPAHTFRQWALWNEGASGTGGEKGAALGAPVPADPRLPAAGLLTALHCSGEPLSSPWGLAPGRGSLGGASPLPATRSQAGCDTGRGGAARPLRGGLLVLLRRRDGCRRGPCPTLRCLPARSGKGTRR